MSEKVKDKDTMTPHRGRLRKQQHVEEEHDTSDVEEDMAEFQVWWSSMVDNRQRLRKRKGEDKGEGVSLADKILQQRKGKEKEKDDLPLGTSASDLHHEELSNRTRKSVRAKSLSPKPDQRTSKNRSKSISYEERNQQTKKHLHNRQSSSTSDYSTSTETDSDSYESESESENQKTESNSRHVNKAVVIAKHRKIESYSRHDSHQLTSTKHSKTESHSRHNRNGLSSSKHSKTESRNASNGLTSTQHHKTVIISSNNVRDRNQYVSCETGSISKEQVNTHSIEQVPKDKYNNGREKGETTHKETKIIISHSASEDKSMQTKQDKADKKHIVKHSQITKKLTDHSKSERDNDRKPKPEVINDDKSVMETPVKKDKHTNNDSTASNFNLDTNSHKTDQKKSKAKSSEADNNSLNDQDQYSLPPSHPVMKTTNDSNQKLHNKDNNKRHRPEKRSRDTTTSVPLLKGSPREHTHASSQSLPETGAKSVLPPHKSNWISWESDEGENDNPPNKDRSRSEVKLPRLISRQSEPKLSLKPAAVNHSRTSRVSTKLPGINTRDRKNLINQRSDSTESGNSPWADKTPIPDHLKHLSNDYAPVRVSSLPGNTTQDRLNVDTSRRHSSPNPREPKRRNTTSPYVSNKFKNAKMERDIEKMERKVNRDLNDIIHKFRDKSLDIDSDGW